MMRLFLLSPFFSLLLLAVLSDSASAGTLAWRRQGYALTTHEQALISWNPASHVEHLIQQVDFDSDRRDLGWLIPTPSVPTILPGHRHLFEHLAQQTAPTLKSSAVWYFTLYTWLRNRQRQEPVTDSLGPSFHAIVPSTQRDVTVLEQTQIADYEVAVLRSANLAGLQIWLKRHDFALRPELNAWVQPYLAKHWALTAIRLSKPSSKHSRSRLEALDLRFLSPKPFYPAATSSLRLFVLAPQPLAGRLIKAPAQNGQLARQLRQPAASVSFKQNYALQYRAPLNSENLSELLGRRFELRDLTPGLWISSWQTVPAGLQARADIAPSELYFEPTSVRPYLPLRHTGPRLLLPLDLLVIALVAGYLAYRKRAQS